jgi:hypothetical protein
MPPFEKPPDLKPFWSQIWVNTASWLIICTVLGVGYIAYTVPRMLDLVLRNQDQLRTDVQSNKAVLLGHENRILRLEAEP